MFGMGWPEIVLIGIVGVLVFGPDKLPEFARQAAQFTRNLRRMAQDAKTDLTREFDSAIGGGFTDASWRDLDPREVVRRTILEDSEPSRPVQRRPQRELQPGERPPVDPDAT